MIRRLPAAIRNLDPASRWAVRWMMIRVCMLVLVWTSPWFAGMMDFGNVLLILSAVFAYAAFFAIILACLRREPIGAPSLNVWDEAVAFLGLANLVHALHRFAC